MTEKTSPLKTAICEFKAKSITIKKESSNPFFKSKYADLATILEAIEVEAAKCGLTIISLIEKVEDGLVLTTKLEHKDSDEVRSSSFPVFGAKPQEIGSSVTYARRYNIQSLLNLAAEDDDGNEANKAVRTPVNETATFKKNFIAKHYNAIASCDDTDQLDIYLVSVQIEYNKILATYALEIKQQIEDETESRIEKRRKELKA